MPYMAHAPGLSIQARQHEDGRSSKTADRDQGQEAHPCWEIRRVTLPDSDGAWITFLSHRAGNNLLYRMRPDGSELTPIFGGELSDVPGLKSGQILYRQPHWTRQSPDRRFFLSWARDISLPEENQGSPLQYMIHLGRTDGGPTRVLAPVGREVFCWSPDSRQFAHSRGTGPDPLCVTGLAPRVPSTQVVVAAVDGSHEKVVLEKPGYWTACDWSQDGTKLLLLYEPRAPTPVRTIGFDRARPGRSANAERADGRAAARSRLR